MAVITNTQNTYDLKGLREDLSDVIYNISPTDCPGMSNVGRAKADAVLTEWQVDSLAAAAANSQLEGDDLTFTAQSATTRVGNYCQISRKDAIVSGTAQKVDKAGRKSEMAYQLAKRSAELKRDMETILFGSNTASVAGNTTTARKTGSILAFLRTNVDKDGAGVNPTFSATTATSRTDSTVTRAFTETQLKNVLQLCWASGGNPEMVMLDGTNKQTASGFSGVATKTFYQSAVKATSIIGAADVYVSDFGTVSFVPNRFMRHKDVLVLDTEYWAIAYLRPFSTVEIAKTGDADKRMIVVEYALKGLQEAASGLITDIA